MPTYTFFNKTTKKQHTELMKIAEMEQFLIDNPDICLVPSAPLIHSGRGLQKPDSDFRDLLKKIKKENRGDGINTY